MLHANLKAVCSPQITSIGGGAGDTDVHVCAHSGILEELLGVFNNQVLWFECSLSTRCVGLCELQSYAFLLIMDGAPSHMSSGQNH